MKTIMRIILFSLAVLVMIAVSTQDQTAKTLAKRDSIVELICGTFQGEPVYAIVDESCEFPGGIKALRKYLENNISYPIDRTSCIQGRVIVQFTVAKDGTIHQIKVIRSLVPKLDKEAIRLVKAMPKWKPGKIKGKPVHQRFSVPVDFRLK